MDYYEQAQNVEQYLKFVPSHDGSQLVDILAAHLPAGSTVLELGMGPGKDFARLRQKFEVTGSDASRRFLELNRAQYPGVELLHLDARTLEIDRRFDAIFSNKALIHMERDELAQSFSRQHAVLNDDGLILHSFWAGQGDSDFDGLRLVYYDEETLSDMLEPLFDVVEAGRHAKMSDGDSVYVLARRRS